MSPYTTYAAHAAVKISASDAPGTTQSEKNANKAKKIGSIAPSLLALASPIKPRNPRELHNG